MNFTGNVLINRGRTSRWTSAISYHCSSAKRSPGYLAKIEPWTILTTGSGLTTWLRHTTDLVTSHHQLGYATPRTWLRHTTNLVTPHHEHGYATPPTWLRHTTNLVTATPPTWLPPHHQLGYTTPPIWLRHTTNLVMPHHDLATPHHCDYTSV